MTPFAAFPKIPRLSRRCLITEKIDGTNASILINEDDTIQVGSRNQWITPENDNAGFARWVKVHETELRKLGYGHHFGEWWGSGIQRSYGLEKGERRFSLFNSTRWTDDVRPPICSVVPILYDGLFTTDAAEQAITKLREGGSLAAPGFMRPEGIIIYHVAGNLMFKKTLDKDETPKGME